MASALKVNLPCHRVATVRTVRPSVRAAAAAGVANKVSTYNVTFVNVKTGVEKVIKCGADEYILDAADAGGLDLPASCRGGVCGSCVSKLDSGKVDDSWQIELDDGNVLSKEQMLAGYILPCSTQPRSDLKIVYSNDWGVSVIEGWSHTARA